MEHNDERNDMELNVDVPLLRKGVEWVEEQDKLEGPMKQWFQGSWVVDRADREEIGDLDHRSACGSAYCFAGYIGVTQDERFTERGREVQWATPTQEEKDLCLDAMGGIHISVVARTLLGISEIDACDLFDAENSAADIRRIAEKIAGEKL